MKFVVLCERLLSSLSTILARIFTALLPRPQLLGRLAYVSGYADLYFSAQDEVITWHKAELYRLDGSYRLQHESLLLVAARQKAVEAGIGPMDPRYPELPDLEPDSSWIEELLPRSSSPKIRPK